MAMDPFILEPVKPESDPMAAEIIVYLEIILSCLPFFLRTHKVSRRPRRIIPIITARVPTMTHLVFFILELLCLSVEPSPPEWKAWRSQINKILKIGNIQIPPRRDCLLKKW